MRKCPDLFSLHLFAEPARDRSANPPTDIDPFHETPRSNGIIWGVMSSDFFCFFVNMLADLGHFFEFFWRAKTDDAYHNKVHSDGSAGAVFFGGEY